MVDVDTFLTTLSVLVDDFCKTALPLETPPGAHAALDSSGIPTRDAKRRGAGWLPGLADIGWSNRLGWYEGFHLLIAVNPRGIMTGFGFGPASAKDQPLAETFFARRRQPHPRCLSVGKPALDPY